MILRPIIEIVGVAIADCFTYPLQPQPGPCELDAQNRKTDWYENERRTWRHDHHDTDNQDRCTNNSDDDAPGHLICNVKNPFDHRVCPSLSRRLAVALGS